MFNNSEQFSKQNKFTWFYIEIIFPDSLFTTTMLDNLKKEVVIKRLEQYLNKWVEIFRENPDERSLYYPEDIDLDGILQRNKQLVRMSKFRSVASIQQTVDMIEDRNANFLESPETYTANVDDITNNEGLTDQRISSFQTVEVNEEFCAICTM